MVTIQDLRRITPFTNSRRNVNSIKNIARHHSATTDGDWTTFWKYWNGTKGWGTGGYHEIILRDGTVQLCYDPEEITNGVANHNSTTYHITVVGNGSFTDAQERAWEERCLYNLERFELSTDDVKGHREFNGANTACPGIDMNMVRNRLKELQVDVKQVSNPIKNTTIKYLQKGDSGTVVKELQMRLIAAGYKIDVDGSYGPATENAVKAFQKANKLIVDGLYGPTTKAKLEANIKPDSATPISKPIIKEEETELTEKAIVINSYIDYPAVQKLHIRTGYPIFERAAVKEKVAKELIIAGGGSKGLEKFADRLTDLSGKNRETTVANVAKYMNK